MSVGVRVTANGALTNGAGTSSVVAGAVASSLSAALVWTASLLPAASALKYGPSGGLVAGGDPRWLGWWGGGDTSGGVGWRLGVGGVRGGSGGCEGTGGGGRGEGERGGGRGVCRVGRRVADALPAGEDGFAGRVIHRAGRRRRRRRHTRRVVGLRDSRPAGSLGVRVTANGALTNTAGTLSVVAGLVRSTRIVNAWVASAKMPLEAVNVPL